MRVALRSLPPLPAPRAGLSGARLADGRALLAGGSAVARRERGGQGAGGACEDRCYSAAETWLVDGSGSAPVAAGPRLSLAREEAFVAQLASGGVVVAGGSGDYG